MKKTVLFALIMATHPAFAQGYGGQRLSNIPFAATVFPTHARTVARNTAAGSAGLILVAALGEMIAKSIRALPPQKPHTQSPSPTCRHRLVRGIRNTKKVTSDVFCSLKPWKALGADLAALIKPPTREGTSQKSIFYAKHRALCWATGIATAYTVAAWARYGVHCHKAKAAQAKKVRAAHLKKILQQHTKALGQINFLKKLAQKLKTDFTSANAKKAAHEAELERHSLADEQTRKEKERTAAKEAAGVAQSAPKKPLTFKQEAAQMRARLAAIETRRSAATAKAKALETANKEAAIATATRKQKKTSVISGAKPNPITLFYKEKKCEVNTLKRVKNKADLPDQTQLSTEQRGQQAGYYFVENTKEYWFISCQDASFNLLLTTSPTDDADKQLEQALKASMQDCKQMHDTAWKDGLSPEDARAIQSALNAFDGEYSDKDDEDGLSEDDQGGRATCL